MIDKWIDLVGTQPDIYLLLGFCANLCMKLGRFIGFFYFDSLFEKKLPKKDYIVRVT